ncbi:MAG: UDP-N-acetylmuramate:L-alanyl-gamma-D-glutamyl-meso-diaminopimelate ligase [Gammaproteobacteria bacterium]|nr:MAG: UDP-N-acetylmuramate:L-alanyl-gamma-D-glutamyl-meso-diaminopimelate ligase [Gammaproteobacteria bacterium]
MNIHILGIAGTFMGSLALLAKEMGHDITGCDTGIYPPMSHMLKDSDIDITLGFNKTQIDDRIDIYIIGNAITRGNSLFEEILNKKLKYTSGPQWLCENILSDKKVIAIAGTHGKTTTTSMVIKILSDSGLDPGFLVGGLLPDLGISASLGDGDYFVIEADEYDTALFDKRSKFIHYKPDILVLNNLEFDHADIFDNIDDIIKSFHHLVRTLGSKATVIINSDDKNIKKVIQKGLYSSLIKFGEQPTDNFYLSQHNDDYSSFATSHSNTEHKLNWQMIGRHNSYNAIAAIAACYTADITVKNAVKSLQNYLPPKRRLELIGQYKNLNIYDDFAHHPTAIATTLQGLRAKVGKDKIIAIIDPASNTMKMGIHGDKLINSWQDADEIVLYNRKNLKFDLVQLCQNSLQKCTIYDSTDEIVNIIKKTNRHLKTNIVLFSNSAFDGIYQKIKDEQI